MSFTLSRQLNRKSLFIALGVLLLVLASFAGWQKYGSTTRVALVNYEDFQIARIVKSANNRMIQVDYFGIDQLQKVSGYDAVLIFGRALTLAPEQVDFLKAEGLKGVKLYMEAPTNPNIDVTNLRGQDLDYVTDYIKYGGSANYRAFFNYVRSVFDGKKLFVSDIKAPIKLASDLVFYRDEDALFETVKEFETYASKNGIHKPGQPKVVMMTSVPGPFNSNRDHVDGLITELEQQGFNVYPMAALNKRFEFLQSIDPAAVVFMPHGRMTLNDAETLISWLHKKNIPVFGPVSVFDKHSDWLVDQQGMNGALLTMSVVLPEFDGIVTPYVIAAKYADEFNFQIFKPIPDRMKKFAAMVKRWIALKATENKDKRVAIYYYKGPGLNAMVASGLEVSESLYNTLKTLKNAGYTVTDLPPTLQEFQKLIQRKGPVLGPYAQGNLAEFFKNGDPALVTAQEYDRWCSEMLDKSMCDAVTARYGRSPGQYMVTVKDGIEYLTVARVQFGNVVLLPQPLPGVGENTFALVHGNREAPPHPYVASYLWTREVFKPDAIMHFGTHGSLEFTPWKQVALSDRDWSDALLGNTPHFYIYTINNVGEGIIAKRRAYATLLSHLTEPFMESGLHNDVKELGDKLFKYHQLEAGPVRLSYAKTIRELANKLKIPEQLKLPATEWSEKDYWALSNHVETLANEKVTSGLYILTETYEADEIDDTTRLIATDPLAYSVAKLDILRGKTSQEKLDDQIYFSGVYRKPARAAIEQLLANKVDEQSLIDSMVTAEEQQRSAKWLVENRKLSDGEIVGGFIALGSAKVPVATNEAQSANENAIARELLIKAMAVPDELAFFQSLASEKQFDMASKSLDPATMEKARVIAKAIPEMAKGLEISQRPHINQLLKMMQKQAVYAQVMAWLNDPSLSEKVEAEKLALQKARLQRALASDNLQRLSLALNDMQRDKQLAVMSRDNLQLMIDTLQFYSDNPALGEAASETDNPAQQALVALYKVNDFAARVKAAQEKASAKLRDIDLVDKEFAIAVKTIVDNVRAVKGYRQALLDSPRLEAESLVNALSGGYVQPSSGGDLVRNPRTLPTGRNLYSIDAEQTPTTEAWQVGAKLAKSLLENHSAANAGAYPKKVTFTLWPGDFIQTEGAQLAQIFYLLGVEPVRDPFGRVVSVKVTPLDKLDHPRIDIVAQTAGQFRDLAASRIILINDAIEMVSQLDEPAEKNFVRAGVMKSERLMIEQGMAPAEARGLATTRVFGGVNGRYDTGIMGLVEKGDAWEKDDEVAKQYLNNMGAVYGKGDKWSYFKEGVFAAALADAEVVVQPRESNTTGALSLDHVYEFMGGMNLAVRSVTGKDPTAYFNDFRQSTNPKMQGMEEAVWTEAQATVLNPEYIKEIQKGSASSAERLAETFRNTYGWNVMKPDAIKDALWDDLYDTYVKDKNNLGVKQFFEGKNPYALQEMTGVMMETARKGMWEATPEQLQTLAKLHAELIEKYDAGCSGFVCDNAKLHDFIAEKLPQDMKQNYQAKIKQALEAPADNSKQNMTLQKEVVKEQQKAEENWLSKLNWGLIIGIGLVLGIIGFLARRRRGEHIDAAEL